MHAARQDATIIHLIGKAYEAGLSFIYFEIQRVFTYRQKLHGSSVVLHDKPKALLNHNLLSFYRAYFLLPT